METVEGCEGGLKRNSKRKGMGETTNEWSMHKIVTAGNRACEQCEKEAEEKGNIATDENGSEGKKVMRNGWKVEEGRKYIKAMRKEG